jgi:hypothetical protein
MKCRANFANHVRIGPMKPAFLIPPVLAIFLGGGAGWFYPVDSSKDRSGALLAAPQAPEPMVVGAASLNAFPAAKQDVFLANLLAKKEAALRGGLSLWELEAFMRHWIRTDREAALAWLKDQPPERWEWNSDIKDALSKLLQAWAELEPDAAFKFAAAAPKNKGSALSAVLEALPAVDPAVAADILTKAAKSGFHCSVPGALIKTMLERDPAAAQQFLLGLPSGELKTDALSELVSEMAQKNPAEALAWAQANGEASNHPGLIGSILTAWAKHDPQAVGPMLVLKQPGKPDWFHLDAARAALDRLGETDPAAALAFVRAHIPLPQLEQHLGSLFRETLALPDNPVQVRQMIEIMGLIPEGRFAELELFRNSWPADLKPAWEKLVAEPESAARTFLLSQIGRKRLGDDLSGFLTEMLAMPEGAARDAVLASVLSGDGRFTRFKTTADSSLDDQVGQFEQLIAKLPSGVQSKAAGQLAWTLIQPDPEKAAEVLQRFPETMNQANVMENLGWALAAKSPPDRGQAWVRSLPPGNGQRDAMSGFVWRWSEDEPEAASQFANQLPPGSLRDGAAHALAGNLMDDDTEAAFAWAAEIQNPEYSVATLRTVLEKWKGESPEQAAQALRHAKIPEDRKNELWSVLKNP